MSGPTVIVDEMLYMEDPALWRLQQCPEPSMNVLQHISILAQGYAQESGMSKEQKRWAANTVDHLIRQNWQRTDQAYRTAVVTGCMAMGS